MASFLFAQSTIPNIQINAKANAIIFFMPSLPECIVSNLKFKSNKIYFEY